VGERSARVPPARAEPAGEGGPAARGDLARNLVSIVSLAALLVDVEGRIVLYNEAAAGIIGSPFEAIGTLTREAWNAR
jgi:PAS domain-containing protein